jgi:hypothetical protein
MPDHPGLDDDATIGGEQTAAAECGAASPERPAAALHGRGQIEALHKIAGRPFICRLARVPGCRHHSAIFIDRGAPI